MSRHPSRFLACVAVASIVGISAHASIEPAVRVTGAVGSCTVIMPGTETPVPVTDGKAYPYGSKIITGADSSIVISLAAGTSARLLPGSQLSLMGTMDSSKRGLQLDKGSVEVTLGDGIAEDESLETVVQPVGTISGRDCTFRVDTAVEDDLTIAFVRSLDGTPSISGPHYSIPSLPEGAKVGLMAPPDLEYIRIKNMRGDFPITVQNEKGEQQPVKTKEGHVVKAWRHAIQGSELLAITVHVTDANGVLAKSFTSTQPQQPVPGETIPEATVPPPAADQPTGGGTTKGTEPTPDDDGEGENGDDEDKDKDEERKRPDEETISRQSYSPSTVGTATVPAYTQVGQN